MGKEEVMGEALRLLHSCTLLPRLVVFDLDYTLWPFWCGTGIHGRIPIQAVGHKDIIPSRINTFFTDSSHECRSKKENPSLYPEAMGILNALKQKGVTMAVASRTPTPDIANCFLNKLGIPSFFADMQIYPSYTHKVEHFQKIRQNTGIPYKSMLFFDDESRNIQSVSQLGVTSMLVEDGVNLKALEQGLQLYAESGTAV